MAENSSFYIFPLVIAFLLFLAKVYAHERAITRGSPSFALAALSIVLAGGYLALSVLVTLPPFSGLVLGVFGCGLVVLAVIMLRSY